MEQELEEIAKWKISTLNSNALPVEDAITWH